MQLNMNLIKILVLTIYANLSFSAPSFEVLRSCMDNKSYNDKIALTMLDGDGVAEKSLVGCQDQYDRIIDNHSYGTLTCNEKFYFIINDKQIDPELSENYSINPEIKPGEEFTHRAIWYKIDFQKNSYLCIRAPLSEHGIGASYNQYYLVENAFDKKLSPKLYYYFFDKDIVPIGSKTL